MSAIITNKLRIYNAQQFMESMNESAVQWSKTSNYDIGDIVTNYGNLYVCVNVAPTTDGLPSQDPANTGPMVVSGTTSDGDLTWLFYNKSAYNNIYLGIGKTNEWGEYDETVTNSPSGGGTETNPPTPLDNIAESFTVLNNLLAIKKIDPKKVTLAVPRIDWEAGNTYSMYSHNDVESIVPNNYVVTQDLNQYNVYKCINNKIYDDAQGGMVETISTVKPTGTDPEVLVQGGDGYVWKYMYSILMDDALKFLTEDYMPIRHLSSDPNFGNADLNNPGHLQWAVQQAAVDGAIEAFDITGVGNAYENNVTGVQADHGTESGTGKYFIKLESTASAIPNAYDGYAVWIYEGTGMGQFKVIDEYTGSTGNYVAYVDSIWETPLDNTSKYKIGPYINMNDPDTLTYPEGNKTADGELTTTTGQGCLALGVVTSGYLTGVNIVNKGSGYTNAQVTVTTPLDTNAGVVATIDAIISPPGGHGFNPVEELNGYYGMIDMKLEYDENNMLPVVGEYAQYRQISVLADPIEVGSNLPCNNELYRAIQHPEYSEYVSTDTADAFAANVGDPTPEDSRVKVGTGKILYIENRQKIARANDQIEDIKIVFEF